MTARPMTYHDLVAEQARIVADRLHDKAPGFNEWPDFDVVRVVELDVKGNVDDAYAHGLAKGGLSTMKQVRVGDLPREIRSHLPNELNDDHYINVLFTLANAAGQEDALLTRNLRAIFDGRATTSYPVDPQDGRPQFIRKEWPALHVTLGCAHDYDTAGSNPNRGLRRGKCRKCGHRFLCDSGD